MSIEFNEDTSGIEKLAKLIEGIEYAMLTTVAPDGSLHSRPMMVQNSPFEGDLWFFTGRATGKTKSIEKESHVNVAFADPENHRFVSVSGRAELVDDIAMARKLWSPIYRAWFPEGLEDANLVLLKVTVDSAEYWDAPSSKMVQLFGLAKALFTGTTYTASDSENKRIHLDH